MTPQGKYYLSEKFITQLKKAPESGMGYQVVSVRTKDEILYSNVLILGANEIGGIYGLKEMPFKSDDILDIQVTHLQKPPDFDQKKWFYVDRQKTQPGV